eukprot:GEZU01015953.1.p1 GENE.GEZU01015953.1~~GEZU01015953.1.p1  ORF type:complete len:130 (-),score=37.44 GEZU01015953.1:89-478(-)
MMSPIIHFWYQLLDRLFKNANPNSKWVPMLKLLLDQLLFAPAINIFFFSVMSVLDGKPEEAPLRIQEKLWPTLTTSWKIWPIAQYINFNYIPPELRVLFGNCVGFFWSVYLAMITSNNRSNRRPAKPRS